MSNICQVIDLPQLKSIVSSNMTVIIGLVCPNTMNKNKVFIKKFLKRKSEKFPQIQFVFIDLTKEQIANTKLAIVSHDYEDYPLIYHIRDGNKILCEVKQADEISAKESFAEIEPYYKKEMESEYSESVIDVYDNDKNDKSDIGESVKEDEIADNEDEIDNQTRLQLNRKICEAIEDRYEKMQKKLFDTVKERFKIENDKNDSEDSDDTKDSRDKGKKQRRKTKNNKKEKTEIISTRRNEKPKNDIIDNTDAGNNGNTGKSTRSSQSQRRLNRRR